MSQDKPAFDPIREILHAPFSRRGMLKTAVGAGMVVPALGVPALAGAKQGEPGGTATMILGATPASWDLTTSTWETWRAVHFLYDRLLTFDADENLLPGLVTEWSISEDGLEYTLIARQGVVFHDGTPFNAEAIQFNIQRHLDQPDSAFFVAYEPVTNMEIVDEYTIKITLGEVRPDFAYTGLAQWGALQVSPTAYQELGDAFAESPVGTGPFAFGSYEPGSSITLNRFDGYWNGAPLLDQIVVKIIPEPGVQIIELEAGTADAALVSPKDVSTVEDMGLTIEQNVSPGAHFISLNVSVAPTDELAVRKAIALSIDRDSMIEALMYGFAEKSRAGVNSQSPFYNDDIPMIEYNPEEAGRILDEAGWVLGDDGIRARDGQPLTVNIFSTDFLEWNLFNQVIQEQLRAVGFDSTISSLEWNAYLDQWRENQGGWNVTYHSQGSIMASVSPIQASWFPASFWSITQIDDATNPELAPIRDQLTALQDEFQVTLDQDRRKAIAKEAQTIFQDNQLTVWLWHAQTVWGVNPRLQGYEFSHAGRVIEMAKAYVDG